MQLSRVLWPICWWKVAPSRFWGHWVSSFYNGYYNPDYPDESASFYYLPTSLSIMDTSTDTNVSYPWYSTRRQSSLLQWSGNHGYTSQPTPSHTLQSGSAAAARLPCCRCRAGRDSHQPLNYSQHSQPSVLGGAQWECTGGQQLP